MILSDPLALRSIHLFATANSCHKPAKSIWLFIDDGVIHFASNSPQNMVLIYTYTVQLQIARCPLSPLFASNGFQWLSISPHEFSVQGWMQTCFCAI